MRCALATRDDRILAGAMESVGAGLGIRLPTFDHLQSGGPEWWVYGKQKNYSGSG
jgi:hypothetical protein